MRRWSATRAGRACRAAASGWVALERLDQLGRKVVEVGGHPDLTLPPPWGPGQGVLLAIGHKLRNWFAGSADHDFLATLRSFDEPGEVGLGVVDVHLSHIFSLV